MPFRLFFRAGKQGEVDARSPERSGSACDRFAVMIFDDVLFAIGRTPLVRLRRVIPHDSAEVLVKLEYIGPGGSVKDRAARSMIDDAEKRGVLLPGSTVVEASAGNTGVGLAL